MHSDRLIDLSVKKKFLLRKRVLLINYCYSYFQKSLIGKESPMMLSLRISGLPCSYQQLFFLILLAAAICYSTPMNKKYDPFLMGDRIFEEFNLISGNSITDGISISNITALARSKRSCCGCCCCCCCWHVFNI